MSTTREDLSTALDRALSGAIFDVGQIVTEGPDGRLTSYDGRPGETLDAQGLCQMYERARSGDGPLSRGRTPVIRMDKASRTALMNALRDLLGEYVDPATDSVGHAFPMGGDRDRVENVEPDLLHTSPQFSSVERLADSLARGAAVAGSDRVAELVADWADGAPMSYRTCIVVPITIAEAVSPVAGVEIVPLPLCTAELPAGLPARDGKSRADYLGQSLLSVDTEATPALFRPETPSPARKAVRAALTPPVTLKIIQEALSLESNVFVDGGLVWDDYGKFFALADHGGRVGGALGHLRHRKRQTTSLETGVSTLELLDDDIRDLSEENIGWLLGALWRADARTRVAVSRWKWP